jgi:transcriptional regulator with XRE-family HTH domain
MRQTKNSIRRARERAGLTQAQLAKQVRMSQSYLSILERDAWEAKVPTLRRIAAALGISVRSLIDEDDARAS